MDTLLKLKMTPGILEEEVLLTKAMLSSISNSAVYISHIDTRDGPNIVLTTEYINKEKLKEDLTKLFSHNLSPIKGYEQVSTKWFTVSIENDNIDSTLSHLLDEKLHSIEDQVYLLDHICSDIVETQEKTKEQVEVIYSFMQKSGILEYKSLIKHLLSVMDANGLVDKKSLEKQVFTQTTH